MTKRFSFVAEITLVVDANGTTQTFYFGTEGFCTKPTDNPANTVVRELLTDPGSIRRELFSGARVTGENRPTYGQLVLINAAGVLDDWIDYGVSGGKVTVRYGEVGTAYPVAWTTVYVAYAYSLIVDFDQVRVLLRDRLYLLDRPIVQDVFAGTGALEGTGIATGTKQVVFGRPGYIPLQLIDQNRQIYFVHANASDERAFVVAGQRYLVYDGGVPLTHQGYATSEADFLATTPSAGHFTIYGPGAVPPTPRTKGPIYIRLGSPAAFDLRVAPIGMLQNFSYENPRTWTFRDLCSRAGMNVFLTPGSYDKQVGNYLVDGDQTYLEVMSDACKSTFSAYGFDNLDNFFTIDLKDPSEGTDDPVYTFDVHNSKSITRQPVPGQEVPVWQVQVYSGRTWPGSTATSLTSEEKDTFTRQPWQNAFTGTSTSVKTANPGAEIASVEIVGRDLDSHDARLAYVRRYLYLFGARRDLITLTAPFSPALLDILLHSKVTVKMPRLGCASGRTFRVVTQSYDLRARTVTFGLWGGDPGPSHASLTGGSTSIGGGSNPVEVVIPGNVILSNFVQRAWGSVLGGGGGGVSILNDWVQRAWGSILSIVVWVPASGVTLTLTDSGRTAEVASGAGVRAFGASLSRATGVSEKRYFEIIYITSGSFGDGVSDEYGMSRVIYGEVPSAFGIGYRRPGNIRINGSVVATGATLSPNDVIGFAVDMSSRKVWVSLNNTWIGSGDPAAGTGEQGTLSAGTYQPHVSSESGSACKVTLNTSSGQFLYSPPTGFIAWL